MLFFAVTIVTRLLFAEFANFTFFFQSKWSGIWLMVLNFGNCLLLPVNWWSLMSLRLTGLYFGDLKIHIRDLCTLVFNIN